MTTSLDSLIPSNSSGDADSSDLSSLIADFIAATDRANGIRLVHAKSPEALFRPSELRILAEEAARISELAARPPIQAHATVVVKATRLCNLRCSYCNSWATGPGNVIGFRAILRRTLEAVTRAATDSLDFVWHGGEMTLLSPALVEKMIWAQEEYRLPSLRVHNTIQTNGVAIGDRWLDLFERIPMSVGVSIDGPKHIHDRYRRAADGRGSYERVMNGLAALAGRGIRVGALIVVGRMTLDMPIPEYLDWLESNGIHRVDFLNVAPCDDDLKAGLPDGEFVPIDEFVEWLASVHDHLRDRGRWPSIRVRFIEDIRAALKEARSPVGCYFSGTCFSDVLTVNPSGSVSPCDKFVTSPDPTLQQPLHTDLTTAITRLAEFQDGLGSQRWVNAQGCRWRHVCRGGCPHDSRALSVRKGGRLDCCGFRPLFDRIEAALARE